jgi:hypothetical protein
VEVYFGVYFHAAAAGFFILVAVKALREASWRGRYIWREAQHIGKIITRWVGRR